MEEFNEERRTSRRYNTEVKIYFDFAYDLETKVKFEKINKEKKRLSKKYSAVSRNISVEGLCFVSSHRVEKEDMLNMEIYLPSAKDPICMTGEVKWCNSPLPTSGNPPPQQNKEEKYHVGIRLLTVEGKQVQETIYYDKEYDVKWSQVLESVFGSYKILMGEKYKRKSD